MTGAGLDWQFVLVTLAALAGAWFLLRPLLRAGKGGSKAGAATGACGRCASAHCGTEATAPAAPELVRIGGRRSGSAPPPA